MGRNSYGIPQHLIALATLLALTLTLLFGGIASASKVAASQHVSSNAILCISATPPSQVVAAKATAWVTVAVHCPPATTAAFVRVKWGDGTIEYFPIPPCLEACPAPPIIISTSHAYITPGDYHPVFCLVPSPASTNLDCTTVQILVVILDPPA